MSAVSVSDSGVRPILADAVELARRALLELEPSGVGTHLGVSAEDDDNAATHRFEATLPGYRGWQWAVVVAAPPGADHPTVSESALLPGPDALIAPDFVPWDQRIRPGDLAPGDLLAPPPGDPRLAPGYTATGDPEVDDVAYQVGLGRTQVLSLEGREEAAQRWYTEFGPDTEMAKAAPSTCGRCGFYLPLSGALRAAFGVCGNAMGADGHVVHTEYGCGAHSDVTVPTGAGSPLYEAYDDAAFDIVAVESPRGGSKTSGANGDAVAAPVTDGVAAESVEVASADVDAGEAPAVQVTAESVPSGATVIESSHITEAAITDHIDAIAGSDIADSALAEAGDSPGPVAAHDAQPEITPLTPGDEIAQPAAETAKPDAAKDTIDSESSDQSTHSAPESGSNGTATESDVTTTASAEQIADTDSAAETDAKAEPGSSAQS
ncbi:DUF3027 domain-containing protein [Nocardia cyriacigeorgica]|uniref:DUF3027 domain-containing protein n=1 Tax=Nocardia cyriacigeorgica TaxID=135487 RepID=UPI0035C75462